MSRTGNLVGPAAWALALGLGLSLAAQAAEPLHSVASHSPLTVTTYFPRDVRARMASMQFKQGLNFVDTNLAGAHLAVVASAGKRFAYIIFDARGQRIAGSFSRHVSKGRATCWRCAVDSDGNRHCWIIPCPDATSPWEPDDVAVR